MSAITGSAQQPGDREITVKDNPKNVIAVPSAPEISESPAPVVGRYLVQASTRLHSSAVGFEGESRRHPPFFVEEKVTPHADQEAQRLEGFDLIAGSWCRGFEVRQHPPATAAGPWSVIGRRNGSPDSTSPQRATASRHYRAQAIAL